MGGGGGGGDNPARRNMPRTDTVADSMMQKSSRGLMGRGAPLHREQHAAEARGLCSAGSQADRTACMLRARAATVRRGRSALARACAYTPV